MRVYQGRQYASGCTPCRALLEIDTRQRSWYGIMSFPSLSLSHRWRGKVPIMMSTATLLPLCAQKMMGMHPYRQRALPAWLDRLISRIRHVMQPSEYRILLGLSELELCYV